MIFSTICLIFNLPTSIVGHLSSYIWLICTYEKVLFTIAGICWQRSLINNSNFPWYQQVGKQCAVTFRTYLELIAIAEMKTARLCPFYCFSWDKNQTETYTSHCKACFCFQWAEILKNNLSKYILEKEIF